MSASPHISLLVFVASAAAFTGCASGPRLYSNQDPGANFSSYRTYAYVTPLGTDTPGQPSSFLSQYLRTAVDREMSARGYQYVANDPDLRVNFYLETQEKIESRETSSVGVYGGGYYGYRGGMYGTWGAYPTTEVSQYTEGTLNIDIVDARRQQLVWEGVAVGRITEEARQNVQAAVNRVVPQMFSRYPVPPPAPTQETTN
jgi:hypothetical protein